MPQPQVPFGRRVSARAPVPASWPAPPDESLEIFGVRPAPKAATAHVPVIPAEPDPVRAELESWKAARKTRRTTDLGVWRWIGVAVMAVGAVARLSLHGPVGTAAAIILGPTAIGLMLKGVRWRRSRPLKDAADS